MDTRIRAFVPAAIATATLLTAPGRARAQSVTERFAFHAEVGAGSMLTSFQRDVFDQTGVATQQQARLAVSLVDWLAIQVSFDHWAFPTSSPDHTGHVLGLAGGLRFEPRTGTIGRFVLDANAGAAFTGENQRLMLDAGIGYEFTPAAWFGVGPIVRFGGVTSDPAQSNEQSAGFWSAGLGVTFRGARSAPRAPGDRDHDGVLDPVDLCPDEPAGYAPDPARDGCPSRDRDGDGVLDASDVCPSVPAGAHPDLARRGCPVGDRDGDTVLDGSDHCPDVPGVVSDDPARNGCPEQLVRVAHGELVLMSPVFFATDEADILPESFPVLRALADALDARADIRRVSIEGHTDTEGDDAHNQQLSQRRAESVLVWLAQHGVDSGRLEAHGFGEQRPLRGNDTAEGRAANRRVEFHITDYAPGTAGAAR